MGISHKPRSRFITYTLKGVLALCLLATSVVAWLFASDNGTQWLREQINKYGAPTVSLGWLGGTLRGPLTFEDVHVETADLSITLHKATIDVSWRKLLELELAITSLEADGLTIRQKALSQSAAADTPSALKLDALTLPVAVSIENVGCRQCRWEASTGESYVMDASVARLSLDMAGLRVAQLAVSSDNAQAQIHAQLNAQIDNATDFPSQLAATWQVQTPEKMTLAGELNAQGNLRKVQFTHELTEPVRVSVQGEVEDFFNQPIWQLLVQGKQIDVSKVLAGFPQSASDAKLTLKGKGDSYQGIASITNKAEKQWHAHAQMKFAGDLTTVKIENMQLEEKLSRAHVYMSGMLNIAEQTVDTTWRWQDLRYPLLGEAQVASPKGNLHLSGKLDDYRIKLQSLIRTGYINEADLTLAAQGDLEQLHISDMIARTLDGVFAANAQVTWRESLVATAKIGWQGVRWYDTQDKVASEGAVTLNYADQRYQFDGASAVAGEFIPASTFVLTGHGDFNRIEEIVLSGETLSGYVNAIGKLDWQDAFNFHVDGQFQNIDPASRFPESPGQLQGRFRVSGDFPQTHSRIEIDLSNLGGFLRGKPVQGSGYLALLNQDIDVSFLNLHIGEGSLKVGGRWAEQANLAWQADLPLIEEWLPDVSGSLHVQGNVFGAASAPLLNLSLKGERLHMQDMTIAAVTANAEVDLLSGEKLEATIKISDASMQDWKLHSIGLTATGAAARHTLAVDARAEALHLDLAMTGSWAEQAWAGSVTKLDIKSAKAGDWQLQNAFALRWSAVASEVEQACLRSGVQSRLCLAFNKEQANWMTNVEGTALPLARVGELTDSALEFAGALDFNLAMQQDAEGYRGHLEAGLPELQVKFGANKNDQVQLNQTTLHATLDRQDGRVEFTTRAGKDDSVNLSLRLPALDLRNVDASRQALQTQLDMQIKDVAWIKALTPELDKISGALSVHLQGDGTLNDPKLSGQAQLTHGQVEIPNLGIVLSKINANLLEVSAQRIVYQLSASSGDGALTAKGATSLNDANQWVTELTIEGDEFEVVHIPEAHVRVSPTLKMRVVEKQVNISGAVYIPIAKLQPKDNSRAVQVTDDLVIIDKNKQVIKTSEWLIYSEVKVTLGKRVRFYGYGFEGLISGGLQLYDEPGQLTKAKGELIVNDGRYEAYGQRLQVENGKLLYAGGPVTNPGLDVKAVRTVDTVTVGVKARGTLLVPKLTLFSEPAMAQSNALSYLVLGRPLDDVSGNEDSALLVNAAMALGLTGGDMLSRQIGDRLGFDEMRVATTDSGEAAMVMGRYLTPKLYISYGVGLFDAMDSMKLRYELTKRWRVTAEKRGDEQGSDLIYTFER